MWSVTTTLCLCSILLALGDAIFLAPCLWRRTRSVEGDAPLQRSRRFLSTDADACTNLCRVPLFPPSVCQRCCQAAGLPVPSAPPPLLSGASPGPQSAGLAALLAALGLSGATGQSLPLAPVSSLNQLPGLFNTSAVPRPPPAAVPGPSLPVNGTG